MIAGIILTCATLLVYDGDSLRCGKGGEMLRLLGSGVPHVVGIDTPEIGSHAKCQKERRLALIAKHRLRQLIEAGPVVIVSSGKRDKTRSHRQLVNIYDSDGREIGRRMLDEGFAREWRPGKKVDWCDE